MDEQVFTHARWQVKRGQEQAFVAAWNALAEAFSHLEQPPLWGTLIRSATDPQLFYSFGPWRSVGAVERMRGNTEAQAAIAELRRLCEEATPALYYVVGHVEVGEDLE